MPSREPIHHGNRSHIRCRRCGRRSYHMRNKVCSACGYGATARIKKLSNNSKDLQRTRRLV